jgi:hypothetical protein
MRVRALVFALVFLVACTEQRQQAIEKPSASGPTALVQSASRQVRWANELSLKALSAIDAEMARPFEIEIEVVDQSRRKATVRNCNSALDLLARGYEAPRDVEHRVLRAHSVRCLALRALAKAAPASRSALDKFQLSDDALNVLPAALVPAVSDEALQRVRGAEAQGKSWRDIAPNTVAKLEPAADDRADPSLLVEDREWRVRVTVYARGDFDGDGSEDLMLRADDQAVRGTYRNHRLFVVTWDPTRNALRIVRELLP